MSAHLVPTQFADCGTVTAYHRHYKRNEQPCQLCRDAYNTEARAKYVGHSLRSAICPRCGTPYQTRIPTQVWCSRRCKQREYTVTRKARKRDASVQRVWRAAVFKRDDWRCQLCGLPVDPTKQYPHPQAPVLDHIIPLVEGGPHSPENVQCAHFRCNSAKGARTLARGEQLRLIG